VTSFKVKLKELSFSFSGVENQVCRKLAKEGGSPKNIARFTLRPSPRPCAASPTGRF
jgi:tRNA A37 threonylcarbamoyltransferase TsaD